jgi:hypothetical protein
VFARKKRFDQGPLPSAADVYPDDEAYFSPVKTVVMDADPHVEPSIPSASSRGMEGRSEIGGYNEMHSIPHNGAQKSGEWRFQMEEEDGVRYGITMGALGDGQKWLLEEESEGMW